MSRDYQAPDWRGLCEELVAELERCRPLAEVPDCLAHARAALAQPEPEVAGPTDEELLGIAAQAIEPYDKIRLGEYEAENNCAIEVYGSELIAFARAVLARWGSSQGFLDDSAAPAPAGEVAELVAWLRMQGEAQKPGPNSLLSDRTKNERQAAGMKLTRAAELLEQRQAAPVPVAVSDRLPSLSQISAWVDKCCRDTQQNRWTREVSHNDAIAIANAALYDWTANALPLPSGEAQP